jgi:precorrin-6Y C5,15-methyltransferase (decarboxylating)
MTCKIIGVLDNGIASLAADALNAIQSAELVIGASRTLELFAKQITRAEQKDLTGHLKDVPVWISDALHANKKIVVLATGDPLCHGIASYLYKKLDHKNLQIIPNVSTIQLAFSHIGIAWQDAQIISIHSKDAGEWYKGAGPEHGLYALLQALFNADKLAILTGPENTPARIARMMLLESIAEQFEITVAENLLCADEKVIQGEPIESIAKQSFNGNDIVILQRKNSLKPDVLFGIKDSDFHQRKPDKGLITKREIRAVSLARMQLKANSIVWDIGAGSGSVGLEAARLSHQGYVYAIEKNTADFEIATHNAKQLGIYNYQLSNNKAPIGLDQWPNADAIFMGGTGGELAALIELCLQRLNADGWLVMNFVTFENLMTAIETLKNLQADWDITQLQASRSQPILHMHRMQAENPVWIVSAQKNHDS